MLAMPCLYRYATYGPGENARNAADRLHWLSDEERYVYGQFTDPRRRAAFLWGRIWAKRLILVEYRAALRLGATTIHPAEIQIDSGLRNHRRTGPQVTIAGRRLPWSLSIAHTDGAVLVALGRTPGVRVGVDLVEPVVLPRGFGELWLTTAERRWLGDSQPGLVATLWAIKEAVYKAAGGGRPFTPQTIEVLPHPPGGFVSRPACELAVWQTPHGETAVVAHTRSTPVSKETNHD
jgi:phosphopantetheinyl transferase